MAYCVVPPVRDEVVQLRAGVEEEEVSPLLEGDVQREVAGVDSETRQCFDKESFRVLILLLTLCYVGSSQGLLWRDPFSRCSKSLMGLN